MDRSANSILCALCVLLVSSPAWADDLIAPPWRGDAGTTFQEWQFSTSANPATPENYSNPYGAPSASVTVGQFGSGWLHQLPAMGTKTGYWDLGGEGGQIVLEINNQPLPLEYKEIWVQVTYFRDITQAPEVTVPGAQFVSGETRLVESVPTGGSWMLDQSIWRIEPNPDHEQIIISTIPEWGAVVDQVVVDTICAPEPASITMLMLAGAALRWRRRREA